MRLGAPRCPTSPPPARRTGGTGWGKTTRGSSFRGPDLTAAGKTLQDQVSKLLISSLIVLRMSMEEGIIFLRQLRQDGDRRRTCNHFTAEPCLMLHTNIVMPGNYVQVAFTQFAQIRWKRRDFRTATAADLLKGLRFGNCFCWEANMRTPSPCLDRNPSFSLSVIALWLQSATRLDIFDCSCH